jgi:hypothetical protein
MQYLQIVEQQLRIYIKTKNLIPLMHHLKTNIYKIFGEVGLGAYL